MTAVEWLIYELNTRQKPLDNSQIDELFEQAKEMEKEQIRMAFTDGHWNGQFKKLTSEEYYEKTYNK
jgi:hypothetical protein